MMVLILERQIHPKIRLKEQDKYSERMATGEKALVMKQTMSVSTRVGKQISMSCEFLYSLCKSIQEEKLEEIQNIIEMKVTHRRNINKRRAKWGFESNSTIGMGR